MAAPIGNKNARKWTEDKIMALLRKTEHMARKPQVHFLGTALVNLGLYKDIWRYWRKMFGHVDHIASLMQRIDSIFEAKLVEGGLTSKFPANMVMFLLRCCYSWTDRPARTERPAQTERPARKRREPPPLEEHRGSRVLLDNGGHVWL